MDCRKAKCSEATEQEGYKMIVADPEDSPLLPKTSAGWWLSNFPCLVEEWKLTALGGLSSTSKSHRGSSRYYNKSQLGSSMNTMRCSRKMKLLKSIQFIMNAAGINFITINFGRQKGKLYWLSTTQPLFAIYLPLCEMAEDVMWPIQDNLSPSQVLSFWCIINRQI